MKGLSERARANYLRVRALVGRDFGWPMILSCLATRDVTATTQADSR
jgi:hypothetical protein